MFAKLLSAFQDSPLALWGPFFMLLLCGIGLPVPEDVVLLAAGALGQIEGRTWMRVSVLMYIGVMAGDSTIFFAGRYLGGRLRTTRWFQRYFASHKQEKVELLFDRYGSTVLFIGRFLPGLRAPIFFTAGSMRVRYWRLLAFDGFAALISVPFFVWLGHWLWSEFQDDIAKLDRALSRTHSYSLVFAGVVAVVGAILLWRLWRRHHRQKNDGAE